MNFTVLLLLGAALNFLPLVFIFNYNKYPSLS